MRIRVLRDCVIAGSVYFAGWEGKVDDAEAAQRAIQAGDAEAVEETA